MQLRIEVLVQRGEITESFHRVQAALVTTGGERRCVTASPERITTFRSAAKPFQLLPLVERGHADRLACSAEELAVMTSSHTGSARHVEMVAGLLARIGLSAADLRCGYHEPLDPGSRERLADHPEERTALYNNCSGKHAAMLALARFEGWSTHDYQRLDHPVQRLMRETFADVTGLSPGSIPVAVDGCSVAVFGVPLERMALAYARLGAASAEGSPRERSLARIREAMRTFPVAVGGAQRFSTALMAACDGRIVAKGGAEGLECLAVPEAGLGVAVKCEDGQERAVAPAVLALLEHAGAIREDELERLAAWRRPVVRNHAGLEVGAVVARVETLVANGT